MHLEEAKRQIRKEVERCQSANMGPTEALNTVLAFRRTLDVDVMWDDFLRGYALGLLETNHAKQA